MIEQTNNTPRKKTAVLFSVQTHGVSNEENHSSLLELRRLVKTMGLEVVATLTQRRSKPEAGTLLGAGKLKELAGYTGGTGIVEGFSRKSEDETCDDKDEDYPVGSLYSSVDESSGDDPMAKNSVQADVVIYDGEISTKQLINLEKATGVEVLDRTGVILEIFNRHAKSREALIQVEIAKLSYLAPRLRVSHIRGDRQGGGIGSKGIGETSHELNKRHIRDRISELKSRLEGIRYEQNRRRSRRKENFQVSLVGYTNAGKSSLMRKLTGSDVLVEDKLFATLDTRVKSLYPEAFPPVLVSDTVGFIKKLPHDLVASFQSTLDEALAASLLLFTVDASDPVFRSQLAVTQSVIEEIGGEKIPNRLILNKIDKLTTGELEELHCEFPDGIFISAHNPEDIATLRKKILQFFESNMIETTMVIPYSKGHLIGQLKNKASMINESYDETGTEVTFKTFPETLTWLQKEMD
ncbi:MAG: GTPase HflX [Desulfobacter sp.]|uniref:GTPase HflX n=1 Tax=Desulfobacter sp. UBA2225 TaxID=1961413 RepID=UPI001B5F52A1|nr:GTPase HflX [Desulfobacter sp. UBA2225]MBP9599475.1 GTPase HflX [Desulfobacter sp.]